MKTTYALAGIASLLFLLSGASGCATVKGAHPEDMSHADHLSQAAEEEQLAQEADQKTYQYQELFEEQVFPGYRHFKSKASLHKRRAAAHAAAAEELREFHSEACVRAEAQAALCPLEDFKVDITSAKRLPDGIEVLYPKDFPMPRVAVERQARCHYAEGRILGHVGMPGCPLFIKGLTIRSAEYFDGAFVITITTDNPQSLSSLHQWLKSFKENT